jgi:hypothetical protein
MPGFKIKTEVPTQEKDRFSQGTYNYNDSIGPDSNTEVARNYRWLFEVLTANGSSPLGDTKDGILIYAQKCSRPAYEADDIVIHHGQSQIHRPGKIKWNPIEITFYERIKGDSIKGVGSNLVNDAARRIYEWWSLSMIDTNKNLTYKPTNYQRNAIIQQLDGTGKSVWTYHLYNCWPLKVTPSDMNYTSTDLSEITVTLRFDKARESTTKLQTY